MFVCENLNFCLGLELNSNKESHIHCIIKDLFFFIRFHFVIYELMYEIDVKIWCQTKNNQKKKEASNKCINAKR